MKLNRSPLIWVQWLLLACALLTACKKGEESTPIDEPVVTIQPDLFLEQAVTSRDSGLTLNFKVNKVPDSLLEYGFLIGTDSTFKAPRALATIVRLGNSLASGNHTVKIAYGLVSDTLYYAMPYIRKINYIQKTYNVKSFTWKGDFPIQIDSLYPLRAIMGDTVTIRGKQLGERVISVNFSGRAATLVYRNDSTMAVIVPSDLQEINPLVTVRSYNNNIDTVSKDFILAAPEISQFTNKGTFRDTVTITGQNFSRFPAGNVVKFGNIAAKVTSFSKTKLRVIVPDDIEFSKTTLTVNAQLQVASGSEQFVIHKPELNLVPGSGFSYEEITLKGKHFHPLAYKNIVRFEGNAANITSGSTSELRMRIPYAAYPKRTARVVLTLLDYEISYSTDLSLLENWILVAYDEPFRAYNNSNAFMLDNVPYLIARPLDFRDTKTYLWKFNVTTLSWQQSNLPFEREMVTPTVATVAGKAYVYTAGAVDNLWEYDPSQNRWTKKANYPAAIRLRGTMFAIGDHVYIGMGFNNGLGTFINPDNTFYKYNTKTDTWSKETDYPTEFLNSERKGPSSFVIGDKAYIACGSTHTGMTQFHSYQPSTRTWRKLADFSHPRNETTAFSYGGFGFVAGGLPMQGDYENHCFRYNVSADRWENMKDRIGPQQLGRHAQIERGYSFVVDGRAFVGGGNSSNGLNQLFMIDLPNLLKP